MVAEIAEAIGLPAGVLNVVTADREVSELLVRDPRVDKITFTGSTAAGRRIASICGDRIARCTLELGGKSAALILDDMDLGEAAATLARAECMLSGQVCSSLTRIVVTRRRHDELVEALAGAFSQVRVGIRSIPRPRWARWSPADSGTGSRATSPRAWSKGPPWRPAVDGPKDLDRGYYVEPTVFGNVDKQSVIAQEEIFGPVLTVIPVDDEEQIVAVANDTIYGLNASVFTPDVDRARQVARRLRSGTVGHNAFRTDFGIAFGGFKQSGIGREGGTEGLLPFLETKTVILEGVPGRVPLRRLRWRSTAGAGRRRRWCHARIAHRERRTADREMATGPRKERGVTDWPRRKRTTMSRVGSTAVLAPGQQQGERTGSRGTG